MSDQPDFGGVTEKDASKLAERLRELQQGRGTRTPQEPVAPLFPPKK